MALLDLGTRDVVIVFSTASLAAVEKREVLKGLKRASRSIVHEISGVVDMGPKFGKFSKCPRREGWIYYTSHEEILIPFILLAVQFY